MISLDWKNRKFEDLIFPEWNPRQIKEQPFKELVKSIKKDPDFIRARPVIVSTRTGKPVVVAGNMRARAAKEAGMNEIPVIEANLTEAKEFEWGLTDNMHRGEWDMDKLFAMPEGLLEEVGFSNKEIQKLVDGNTTVEEDDYETDKGLELPVRVARGEIWQLGIHRLMCGDSTSKEDVERLMDGKKADMVFTDPPYGMNLDTDFSGITGSMGETSHGTRGGKYERVIGDNEDFTPELITTIFNNFGYCKEMFLFGGDYFAEHLVGKNDGSWMVWDKRKESQKDAIGSEFELIWSKAKHKRRMLRHDWFGFLSSQNTQDARNRVHPTQKPLSLLVDILKQWGKDGEAVVDLYLGSGSTLIACEQTGRVCYGMEIDPKYCTVILERWEKLTGQKAAKIV